MKWNDGTRVNCAPPIRIGTQEKWCAPAQTCQTTQDDFSKCVTKKKNTREFLFHSNRNKDRKFFIPDFVWRGCCCCTSFDITWELRRVSGVCVCMGTVVECAKWNVFALVIGGTLLDCKRTVFVCRWLCYSVSHWRHSEAIFNGVGLINPPTSASVFLFHSSSLPIWLSLSLSARFDSP